MTMLIDVPNLGVGDRFVWCGRPVTLDRFEHDEAPRRPGRRLYVHEDSGQAHRLHYFDAEAVEGVV